MGIPRQEIRQNKIEAILVEKVVCDYFKAKHIGGPKPFDGIYRNKIPIEVKNHKHGPVNSTEIKKLEGKLDKYNYKKGRFAAWAYSFNAEVYSIDSNIELFWLENIFKEMGFKKMLSRNANTRMEELNKMGYVGLTQEEIVKKKKIYNKNYFVNNREALEAYRKEYVLKNKQRVADYQKRYSLENKDKIHAKNKRVYKKNRKKRIADGRKYYSDNREKCLEQKKEYYEQHKDRINDWKKEDRLKNPEKYRAKEKARWPKRKEKQREYLKRRKLKSDWEQVRLRQNARARELRKLAKLEPGWEQKRLERNTKQRERYRKKKLQKEEE